MRLLGSRILSVRLLLALEACILILVLVLVIVIIIHNLSFTGSLNR